MRYYITMIKSFKDKETQKLFMGRKSKAVSGQAKRRAAIKLAQLDQVQSIEELRTLPCNKIHKLSGDRAGQWSISINDQYRICFRFDEDAGDAYEVEATDYH